MTGCHYINRGRTRGFMLIDVMGYIALISSALVMFALGSVQLAKLFRESYSNSMIDSLRVDSLGVILQRDERCSLAAFHGDGDISLDEGIFDYPTYPNASSAAGWKSSSAFLTELSSYLASRGITLAVNPSTVVERNSWLLFLGPDGRVTAYYRFLNREVAPPGHFSSGVLATVERYAPTSPNAVALTRTHSLTFFAQDETLSSLVTAGRHSFADAWDAVEGGVTVNFPSAYLSGERLYDSTKLSLESWHAKPVTISLRPSFQP